MHIKSVHALPLIQLYYCHIVEFTGVCAPSLRFRRQSVVSVSIVRDCRQIKMTVVRNFVDKMEEKK